MTPWIWLLLALALLFVEFYLPSGVIATLSGLLFIFSLVDAFVQFGAMGGFFFFLVAGVAGALIVFLALYLIQKSSSKNSLLLSTDQEGFVGAHADESLIGKTGVAASDLRPSGFAIIDSKRVQVVSEGRYVEKGSPILVEGSRGAYLVVKYIPENRDR